MNEICSTCGLPKDLCVCDAIAKENQQITIITIKKKFGKVNTVIKGFDTKDINVKELRKEMKTALACGGTSKGGIIELQGDHRQRAKEILVSKGFPANTVEIK